MSKSGIFGSAISAFAPLAGAAIGGPPGAAIGGGIGTAAQAADPMPPPSTPGEAQTPRTTAQDILGRVATAGESLASRYAHGRVDTEIQKSRQQRLYPDTNSLDRLGAGGGGTSGVPPETVATLKNQKDIAKMQTDASVKNTERQAQASERNADVTSRNLDSQIDINKETVKRIQADVRLLDQKTQIARAQSIFEWAKSAQAPEWVRAQIGAWDNSSWTRAALRVAADPRGSTGDTDVGSLFFLGYDILFGDKTIDYGAPTWQRNKPTTSGASSSSASSGSSSPSSSTVKSRSKQSGQSARKR